MHSNSNMDTSKLVPNDPRVEWKTTVSRGFTYSYQVVSPPSSITPKNQTILLLHGFPDLSFGWRNQVPFLANLGYKVVVPDLLGYGRTAAPADPALYTLKLISDDVAAIVADVGAEGGKVILGAHDWGGALAWRIALWHPEIVSALFVVCTPYVPPSNGTFHSLEELVEKGALPNFTYQLQLKSNVVEDEVVGVDKIRQFLRSMYGARTPEGDAGFATTEGLFLDKYLSVGDSPLVSSAEMEYYAQEYARNGMRGPLNWYRTRELNWKDEVALADAGRTKIDAPALFIAATKDTALPPRMSQGMEANFTKPLTRAEVPTSHWALEQAPTLVNQHIANFLAGPAQSDGARL